MLSENSPFLGSIQRLVVCEYGVRKSILTESSDGICDIILQRCRRDLSERFVRTGYYGSFLQKCYTQGAMVL